MTYQSDVVALAPWGYWRLEETSGTTVADASGNTRTATIVGSPTMGVTGQVNNAFTFATSGQCVRLGAASTAVSGSTAHTVMGWVKRSGTPSAYTHIAGPWSSTGVSASFRIALNASGQAVFEVKDNTFATAAATGSANLYDGNWHFIVGTISGTSMKLYVDGVIAATATRGGSSINAAGADFCIGSQWSAYDQGGGSIDEVAWINNAAIAPYQVNNLYVSGKPSAKSYQTEVLADAPGAYLRLDEASGNFADTSGFGNTFTAQTGVSYSQTPMGGATGTGNAVHGDGSHGIATLASLAGLTGTTQTIETIFYMPAGNVTGTIAKIGGSGNGWDIGIWLAESSGGSGRMLGIDRNGLSFVDVGVNPISTGWHHVVAARNGNSMVVIFDGTEVYNNSAWNADGPGTAGVNAPSAALNVGFGDGTNLSSTVVVDSVAWYPTTMSTTRAQAHYTALTSSGTISVGTAAETDSTLAAQLKSSFTMGIATEADSAVPPTAILGVGIATESDGALAATAVHSFLVGTAAEADTALAPSVNTGVGTGTAAEADTAIGAALAITVIMGTASETDSPIGASLVSGTSVGSTGETDTALGVSVLLGVGTAGETDTALSAPIVNFNVGTAAETETAVAASLVFGTVLLTNVGTGFLYVATETSVGEELEVVILDPVIQRAPNVIVALVAGGEPEQLFTFYIDGVEIWSTLADSDGNLDPTSLNVDVEVGAQGDHTLEVHQTTSLGEVLIGTATFTCKSAPSLMPIAMGADAQPVEVPGAVSHDTRHWVLQDLLAVEEGGIGSYILPINPREMTSPHYEHSLSARRTTAKDGQFHVFQAGQVAKEWQFKGYCPTKEMAEKLLEYRNLNRRFYVIDHRNRAWKCVFTNVDLIPRLRHNFNGIITDWGHDYTVSAIIFDQDWETPA